jgi:hypothetical protein
MPSCSPWTTRHHERAVTGVTEEESEGFQDFFDRLLPDQEL